MKTMKNNIRYARFWTVLLLGLMVIPLAGCPESEKNDWRGPTFLNTHLAYVETETGQVALVDPRQPDKKAQIVHLPGAEKEEDIVAGWRQVLVYPDGSHVVYAAQDINTFHIVSDEAGELVLSIPDVSPLINAASFSPDGRWLVFYVNADSNIQDREAEPFDSGINRSLDSFDFPESPSILQNEHRLLVVDREAGETFTLDLPQNDVRIDSIRFSGTFRLCTTGDLCADADARSMELIVAAGVGRLWLFNPADQAEAHVNVVPLSLESSSRVGITGLRISANMAEPEEGTDDREILFVNLNLGSDVLALNMVWDDDNEALSFAINKFPLPLVPYDSVPYVDRGELYLLALGWGELASVHVDSARVSRLAVEGNLRRIRLLEREGRAEYALLDGSDALAVVKLQDLAVFGAKNVTEAVIGFSADRIVLDTDESWRALCLDQRPTRLAAIDLEALTEDDLSASVQRIELDVADDSPDLAAGKLYMTGYCYWLDEEEPEERICDLYGIDLFDSERAVSHVELSNVEEEIRSLPATDDEPQMLIFQDGDNPDRLVTVDTDSFDVVELEGFLSALD